VEEEEEEEEEEEITIITTITIKCRYYRPRQRRAIAMQIQAGLEVGHSSQLKRSLLTVFLIRTLC
jgi:hypothetical protein